MSFGKYLSDLEKRPHWQATAEDKNGPVAIMAGYPGHFLGHYYLYNGKNHDGLRPYRATWVKERFASGELKLLKGSVPTPSNEA
ncbi:MAG TPA: hypothetical protein VH088_00015 [Terriglobales bacterium]|jgi:hypothetical protein|nr:hypothetical protein [Terriglobales bacterium]